MGRFVSRTDWLFNEYSLRRISLKLIKSKDNSLSIDNANTVDVDRIIQIERLIAYENGFEFMTVAYFKARGFFLRGLV